MTRQGQTTGANQESDRFPTGITVRLAPESVIGLRRNPHHPGNLWYISGDGARERFSSLNTLRKAARKRAGLEDVNIHDPRHSFASHICR